MTIYFPKPYPNETLYSIVSRYAQIMRYPKGDHVVNSDLGRPSENYVTVHMPYMIDRLLRSTPYCNNAEYIIDMHTSFPYYSLGMSEEYSEKMKLWMKGDVHKHDLRRFTGGILRYCHLCVAKDRGRFGQTYWRREHQIPEVEVCCHHGCVLHGTTYPWGYITLESLLSKNVARRKFGRLP